MKSSLSLVGALFALASLSVSARALPPQNNSQKSAATPAAPTNQADTSAAPNQTDPNVRAETYYDFTMGHIYEQEYIGSNNTDDAEKAIDFFKKAYALDPSSQVIGEQLSEMYYVAQRTRDAVNEANDILKRDPMNLPVRRLLARIYIRTLSDLRGGADQENSIKLAMAQLTEIVRQDPTDSESTLWLARLDRATNQNDQAETLLRSVLLRDARNEGAIDQLTQLLLDENKFGAAITLLQQSLKVEPSASLYQRLGDAYTAMQDFAHAEQAYRQSTDLDATQADAQRGLAQSLFDEGKFSDAAQVWQKLVNMEPNNASNYLRLADSFRELHQLDKAEQEVLLAKQHAPGNLEVIYNQASVYQAEARYDDAAKVLLDAVSGIKEQTEVAPTRRRTLAILYQLLGQVYRDKEDYSSAIGTFQELSRLGPEEDQRARPLIIETYRSNHDLTRAFEEAKKSVADYPGDRALKVAEALLYGDNNQPDQAAQILKPLLNNSPSDLEIDLDLAEIYSQDGRYGEAEQAVRAGEKFAKQAADKEAIGSLLGDIYARQKNYDQAEKAFQGVLAVDPRNATVLNYYGYVLADRGVRLDEAVSMAQRALAEDPNNAAYLDSVGWAYYKQDKLAEAESYERKAVARDSHDPTMFSHLGDILAKSGQGDQAQAAWEKALDAWHHAVPADFEAGKVSELEQKISDLKRRAQQQKTPGSPNQQ